MKTVFTYLLLTCLFTFKSATAQTYEWGGSFGGDGEDVVLKMYVDPSGNTYTTGYFTGIADFDMSESQFLLETGDFYEAFVQKTAADGQFLWARKMGGPAFDYGTDVIADAAGNVYVTGVFEGIADFDPGAGEYLLESKGGLDIFIVKLNADGNFVWAKTVGGTEYEESSAIGIDALGNVYVSGYFYGPVDFDPGESEFNLDTMGFGDGFVVKLNDAGTFVWAKRFGGEDFDLAINMKVLPSGDSYIVGSYRGTVDFDSSEETVFELHTAEFGTAAYLLHLDGQGNFSSVVKCGEATFSLDLMDVDVDAQGNAYIAGYFGGDLALGNIAGTDTNFSAADFYNGLVLKVDAAGNIAYANHLAGDAVSLAYGVAVSVGGEAVVTGYYGGSCQFGDFVLTKVSANDMESFVGKLDNEGNFTTAKQFGGINFADKCAIGIDANANIYLSGAFEGTVDLNPDADGNQSVISKGFRDNYLIKMTAEPLSINNPIAGASYSVYPNPTAGALNVKAAASLQGESWMLFDTYGRKVASGIFTEMQQVGLENLSSGTYVLKTAGDAIKVIKK